MHERAAQMDALRQAYVDEFDGGKIEEVRQALYDRMDEFSRRSKEAFKKKLEILEEQNPPNLEKRKSALLRELNDKLIKNEINKEKCRRFASFSSWRESPSKSDAEEAVRARLVDVTE